MVALEQRPGHLARRFQQIAVAIFHAEVDRLGHDLTPVQYAALARIAGVPGIDQTTLAGLIAYDRTTIMGVVDRLARKGLVTREPHERDRRAHALHVTPAGAATLESIEPAVDAAQKLILSGLSETESEQFLRLLRKAVDAINDRSRAPLRCPAPGSG